ncbi:hypothetical protein LWC34_35415 [Kibdelosporangium philippinense]|uniref:DUF7919 domain-containing protein n=1 Tax=Kibdelosporangium philippinense TaxID=211113 RepID=A0ABS8ZJU1_9PSEU|nr:hypothetical protein [Kibdelosporangium philippinense]MCE7008074.1 hypothetical protein [Kibdelosporangium philippinense]
MIYAAPSLLPYYVEAHEYRPPQAFVDAVLIRVTAFWDTIERSDTSAVLDGSRS